MRGRSLIVLALVTAAVVIAAVVATRVRAPQTHIEHELLFPALGAHVNDVAGIEVEGGGRKLTLLRRQGHWVVQQGDGYPVMMDRVKQVVVGVADMRVAAIKTANPDLYGRLGVEDLKAPHAASTLLTLQDESGKPLATLIVGKPRRSGAPGDRPGLYVRLPGDAQALLVDGRLDVSSEVSDWFERQLFDIPAADVREVRVQHADGTLLRIARPKPGADLEVPDLPKGKEMQSNVTVSRMGTILEDFSAEGVKSAANVVFPADATTVAVATFEGLIANITAAKIDGTPYAKFAFSFDAAAAKPAADAPAPAAADAASSKPADAAAEAQKLNEVLNGWVFQVPPFKFDLLNMHLEDLLRLEPKAPPPGTADGDAPEE